MGAMPPRHHELTAARAERLLRERIAQMTPGEQLPGVRQLAREFRGVSPATVGKVVGRLSAEGLLVTVPSWGTFRAG